MPVFLRNNTGSISILYIFIVILLGIGAFYFVFGKNLIQSSNNTVVSMQSEKELFKFKTGMVAGAPTLMSSLVIKKYEIDKKYGLDIEYVNTEPGDIERELVEGKYDVAMSGILAAYEYALHDKKLKVLFPVQHFSYDLIVPVDSSIKTLQDLKNKRFGILPKNTAAYPATFIVLKQAGLEPEKDLKLVFGSPDQIVRDLNNGDVEAAIIAYPLGAKLLSSGKFKSVLKFEDVWKANEEGLPMPFVGMLAHEQWWNEHKDIALKIAKTYYEAAKMLQDNPSIMEQFTEYLTQNDINSAAAIEILGARLPELVFETYSEPEMEGIKRYYQRAQEYGFLPKNVPSVEQILIAPSELGL